MSSEFLSLLSDVFFATYYFFYAFLAYFYYQMVSKLYDATEENKKLAKKSSHLTKLLESHKAELTEVKDKTTNNTNNGNVDAEEMARNLMVAEIALTNSEATNIKHISIQKDLEKKIEEMDKKMKETNLKLLTTEGALKTKEKMLPELRVKLEMSEIHYKEMKFQVERFQAEIIVKNVALTNAYEELRIKDELLMEASSMVQTVTHERNLVCNQMDKYITQAKSQKELVKELKMENCRLAETIYQLEQTRAELEGKVSSLHFKLQLLEAQQNKEPNEASNNGQFRNEMMNNMTKLNMEIQRWRRDQSE